MGDYGETLVKSENWEKALGRWAGRWNVRRLTSWHVGGRRGLVISRRGAVVGDGDYVVGWSNVAFKAGEEHVQHFYWLSSNKECSRI